MKWVVYLGFPVFHPWSFSEGSGLMQLRVYSQEAAQGDKSQEATQEFVLFLSDL